MVMPRESALSTTVNRTKLHNSADDSRKALTEMEPSGHVKFDDRGNAVWETWRGRRLEHPGLSLADEESEPCAGGTRPNVVGGRTGYNPYNSGMVKKKDEELP